MTENAILAGALRKLNVSSNGMQRKYLRNLLGLQRVRNRIGNGRHLLNIDMKATTRKATPAQSKLPPVRNQTTRATMPAGKTNRIILATTTMITMPITTSKNNIAS